MTKEFFEHYYTASIQKGEIGTLDNSNELSFEEVKELERRVVYEPPKLLSQTPTDEEIQKHFPENYSFFKLESSGRFVFLHTQYTGRGNHTQDRFGNYFSHSLILKGGNPSFRIIDLFSVGDIFIKEFSIETDKNYKPHLSLREIQLEDSNTEANFKKFSKFLISDQSETGQGKSRILILSKIVDTLINGLIKQKRIIVICDNNDNLKTWMLLINFIFPINLSNQVSFASYVSNPLKATVKFAGISPYCGINSLDENYFTFLDATKNFNYTVEQIFTEYIVELIQSGNFHGWQKLNEQIKEFSIEEFSKQLNILIKYFAFLKGLENGSITELKELILDVPLNKKTELINELLKRNNALLLEYLIEELSKSVRKKYKFKEKQEEFNNIYKEYFEPNNDFRRNNIGSFIYSFSDVLVNHEKTWAIVHCLLFANCSDVSISWLNTAIEWVNNYFDEDISLNDKIKIANILSEKYDLKSLKQESTSNIMKIISFDAINKVAENDDFINQVRKYEDFLKTIKESEIMNVLLLGFNRDKYFYKGRFQDFEVCISIVKNLLPTKQSEFWYKFFTASTYDFNKENDVRKHSLDYLRKKFVSLIFLKQNENYDLFSKLRLENEYTIKWIEEDIREHATSEGALEAFNNYVSNNNNSFLNFFRKK